MSLRKLLSGLYKKGMFQKVSWTWWRCVRAMTHVLPVRPIHCRLPQALLCVSNCHDDIIRTLDKNVINISFRIMQTSLKFIACHRVKREKCDYSMNSGKYIPEEWSICNSNSWLSGLRCPQPILKIAAKSAEWIRAISLKPQLIVYLWKDIRHWCERTRKHWCGLRMRRRKKALPDSILIFG